MCLVPQYSQENTKTETIITEISARMCIYICIHRDVSVCRRLTRSRPVKEQVCFREKDPILDRYHNASIFVLTVIRIVMSNHHICAFVMWGTWKKHRSSKTPYVQSAAGVYLVFPTPVVCGVMVEVLLHHGIKAYITVQDMEITTNYYGSRVFRHWLQICCIKFIYDEELGTTR